MFSSVEVLKDVLFSFLITVEASKTTSNACILPTAKAVVIAWYVPVLLRSADRSCKSELGLCQMY